MTEQHSLQFFSHIGFRLKEPGQVAGFQPGYGVAADTAPLDKVVQRNFHHVQRAVDELGRRCRQLVAGQEDVSVIQIVAQLKEGRGFHPAAAVPGHAHGQGNLVHNAEADAVRIVNQQVGVILYRIQGPRTIAAVELESQSQRQVILAQKIQQPPHTGLVAEALCNLLGPPGGDALHLAQPFRRVLQDGQGIRAEVFHQPLSRGRPYALHHAGGQIEQDFRLGGGEVAFDAAGLKLFPVDRVADPLSGNNQVLSRRGAGDGPHHGHSLAVACDQAQHGIAVVLVLKDYMLNRTADHGVSAHFPHSLLTVVQIFADVLRTADCDPPVLPGNQPG